VTRTSKAQTYGCGAYKGWWEQEIIFPGFFFLKKPRTALITGTDFEARTCFLPRQRALEIYKEWTALKLPPLLTWLKRLALAHPNISTFSLQDQDRTAPRLLAQATGAWGGSCRGHYPVMEKFRDNAVALMRVQRKTFGLRGFAALPTFNTRKTRSAVFFRTMGPCSGTAVTG